MRYQVRLIDEDLQGLAREIVLACCKTAAILMPEPPGTQLHRSVYRAVRGVLRARLQANRFCGLAHVCGHGLRPTEVGTREWTEQFPPEPERIQIYLTEVPPTILVSELLNAALRAVVRQDARRLWKGLARLMSRQIEQVLRGRVFRSDFCGEARICLWNEMCDAWTRGSRLALP